MEFPHSATLLITFSTFSHHQFKKNALSSYESIYNTTNKKIELKQKFFSVFIEVKMDVN